MAAVEAVVVSPSSLETDTAPHPETAGKAAATAATSPAMVAAAAVGAAAKTGSEIRVSKAAMATKLLSLSGVFAVHKPKGPTSAELLNRLKEKLLAGTAARVGTRLRRRLESEATENILGFLRAQGSRNKRKGKVRMATEFDLDGNPGPFEPDLPRRELL